MLPFGRYLNVSVHRLLSEDALLTPAEQDAAEGITKREFEPQTFHVMF